MVMEQSVFMLALQRTEHGEIPLKTIGYYQESLFDHMRQYACRLARELEVEFRIVKIRMNTPSFEDDMEKVLGTINKEGVYESAFDVTVTKSATKGISTLALTPVQSLKSDIGAVYMARLAFVDSYVVVHLNDEKAFHEAMSQFGPSTDALVRTVDNKVAGVRLHRRSVCLRDDSDPTVQCHYDSRLDRLSIRFIPMVSIVQWRCGRTGLIEFGFTKDQMIGAFRFLDANTTVIPPVTQ